jgi:hypothetical protein
VLRTVKTATPAGTFDGPVHDYAGGAGLDGAATKSWPSLLSVLRATKICPGFDLARIVADAGEGNPVSGALAE